MREPQLRNGAQLMNSKAAFRLKHLPALLALALFLLAPVSARADTLSDLYGTAYDRSEVIEAGEADDPNTEPGEPSDNGAQVYSLDDSSGIALYSEQVQSISPRYVSSEMLYFCKWESGQNYDQGLSWGDGYHAMGYFQFDNRYDLGSFLRAVYTYNPSKYSSLAVIGNRYGWDVSGATRSSESFTQLGSDLNQAWHGAYAADPSEFSALQNDWAYTQYYDGSTGIRGSLRAMGIDIDNRSDSVKSLVWGMANLFGQGGGSGYVARGFYYGANWFIKNSGVNDSMDDATFVSVLCDYVIDNVARRYSGQPEYWQGWQNRYRDEKSHYLSVIQRWVFENDSWYLVNAASGIKATGWAYVRGTWYYLDPNSGAMRTGWVLVDGSWYWLDSSGAMKTGWLLIGGTWYWLNSSGAMATGWQAIGSSWYWFNSSGAMTASRTLIDGLWSDFAGGGSWTGYASGWDARDGATYWLEDGSRATGWRHIDDNWYWFDQNGKAAKNTTVGFGSSTYAFDVNGCMAESGWCYADGSWYLASSSGALLNGWQRIGGAWYMLDRSSYAMHTGWYLNGNAWYHLSSSGAMDTGWFLDGRTWYWLDPSVGDMRTGWQCISGTWYYLSPNGGAMQTGWLLDGNTWYYLDGNGAMQASRWIGNYYLLGSGAMARSQWIGPYYVDANGCWLPGA